MKKENIPGAPLLEIIFDGRNKEYGAYELRKQYNARLTKALGITAGMAIIILLSSYALSSDVNSVKPREIPDIILTEVDMKKDEPVIIPPKPVEPPRVATIRDVTFRIVKDELVKKEEMPPEVTDRENKLTSTITQDGDPFDGAIAPPVTTGGVVEAPKVKAEDTVFLKVEKEAEFPGGAGAWAKYVSREVNRNIDELQDDGRSGTVVVMFIVDKEGAVSDVKALTCGESGVSNCLGAGTKLAEIAVNAIRKGPKWQAAFQNGKNVKAYRRQPVTFQLQEE